MNYSIEELKDGFSRLEWDDPRYKMHVTLIKNIEANIKGEKIKQIYPKNMFVDNGEIEFYTFTDKYIFITKVDKDNTNFVVNTILKIKDIAKLEKVEGNEYEPSLLKIYFYNGNEITFDSKLDTNEHHMRKFNKTINEIVNDLV